MVSILDLIGRDIRITVTDRLDSVWRLSFDVFKHLVNFARKRVSLRFQIVVFSSHSAGSIFNLQLKPACVPLTVMRPMTGTFPSFEILSFSDKTEL